MTKRQIQKIITRIEQLDETDLFWKAWEKHNDSYGRTEVWFTIDDGKVHIIPNLTAGTKIRWDEPAILLFTLPQHLATELPWEWEGDILTPDEYEECQEMIEDGEIEDEWEYLDKKRISFHERLGEYYFDVLEGEVIDWADVKLQLKKL